jgi:hypothetical protein
MNPQRRGILATVLAIGLTLAIGVGVVLAIFLNAKPTSGPRDDGSGNQTLITLSGDLLDTGVLVSGWQAPDAYWDTPNPANPLPAYEIPISGGGTVDDDGTFSFNVRVPLKDGSNAVVRPGLHTVTVCSRPLGVTGGGTLVCTSDTFTVQKPIVTLSRNAARPGENITVHGERFAPGTLPIADKRLLITLGGDLVQDDPSVNSTFNEFFSVPNFAPGNYQLVICNTYLVGRTATCHPKDTVKTAFTILSPQLKLNPSSGFAGAKFDVTGTGFYADRELGLFFGPVGSDWNDPGVVEIKPAVSKHTNANGSFGPYSHVPNNPPGDYWVFACTNPPSSFTGFCDSDDTFHSVYTILAAAASLTPKPTAPPTASPTPAPTASPTPSSTPTASPTVSPSQTSTATPTPTLAPTVGPASAPPTDAPTPAPTAAPTDEPTAAPTPTTKPVLSWPEHLHSPGQTAGGGIDLGVLGGISLLALLIAFLVPFPGTLFNKTVESNYEEIQGWIAGLRRRWMSLVDSVSRGPLGPVREWIARMLSGRFGVLIFLGLSALVYGFLSPSFGLDMESLALFLGLLVGLAFITAAFELPLRIYHGRASKQNDRGVLRALWWTLLVAVICVVVSRLADFQPGYLYGLIVSIVFVTEISKRDEGIANWLAAIWLLVLSFVAWILLAFVRQGSFDPWLTLFLQTVLVTFVVAGIETLAVGLLPMRFLPGHPLFLWRRSAWFAVFALSVMGYLLILVDPANGYLSDDSRTPMLIGVIFLVIFGIVSLGTWAYFRYRPARQGADPSGEAPAG